MKRIETTKKKQHFYQDQRPTMENCDNLTIWKENFCQTEQLIKTKYIYFEKKK